MVDYSETIEVYDIKVDIEVKIILWPLSKITQNETGSQVSDTEPLVLWYWKCFGMGFISRWFQNKLCMSLFWTFKH